MRFFAIAADVVMGAILGLFLYVALSRSWPPAARPAVAILLILASILLALFRRPNGSLAVRRDRR
jgi:hypothetical protein